MFNLYYHFLKIEFKPSDESLDSKKYIGLLINNCENKTLIKRLKNKKPKIIDIDFFPTNVHSIEFESMDDDGQTKLNKNLYLSDFNSIKVLNDQFQLIQTVNSIDGNPIAPSCLTSNMLDTLFISDLNYDSIMLCDLKFKLIKKIGSHGTYIEEFDHISNLTYSNRRLFVCDTYNQRIQCFNSYDLSFLFAIQFDFEPNQIEIYDNIACIMGNLDLHFYELNNCFNLLRKFDCGDCTIGLFNSHFIYELSYNDNRFKVYSLLNYDRSDEISDSLNELTIEYDDTRCLTSFDQKLLVALSSGKIFVF